MQEAAPFVGRGSERKRLVSLLDEVSTRGQGLIVRGEPGIGKSRLLAEAVSEARRRGLTVLSASGVQSEAQLPFAGLHQLLRPVRHHAAGLLRSQSEALEAAFGLIPDVTPEFFRIAMAVLDLLCEVATEDPLLLVVDDAQWLDRPSADVLAFVARRIESDPILLLVAARDGYPADLTVAGLPEQRLAGLAEVTAAALLDAVTPGLSSAARARVLKEAAGNPLALLELPAVAQDVGEVRPLTERLERAFAGRALDLPGASRLVLLAAALDDGDALGEILEAASAVAGSPVGLDDVERAVEAALVDVDGMVLRFRHPLIRSAVRQSAGLEQRRRMHEALADALESDPDRQVWHRAALASGTNEQLARELEEAAARARRRGALDVAVAALGRAVELSSPDLKVSRMLATSELAYERGRPDIATSLLREIERADLTPLEAARARFIRELMDSGSLADYSGVVDLIAMAERAGATGDRRLHHQLLWVAAGRTWRASPAPDIRQLVVDAADRAGPPTATDPRLVSVHAYAHPYASASRVVVDCLREAARLGVTGAEAAGYLASAGMVTGAFYDALRFCAIAIGSARAEGRLGDLPRLLATQAILAARLPDWDVAIPAADEARRLASELSQPLWNAIAETAVALIGALRGDPDATTRATARAQQIALPLGAKHVVALALLGFGVAEMTAGRYGEAFDVGERLYDPADPGYHLIFACMGIGDHAEAALLSDRAEAGRQRLDEVEAMVGDAPTEWLAITVRHARAVLAEDEAEASMRFEEALTAGLDHWPFWRGRLLLAQGRWLRRHRRMSESRAPLREARDMFDAIGASGWGDQARGELRAAGERSRRRTAGARETLTAQELQIAQLAAQGLSNRAIGQQLFLSHRTVSTHLYRVFPKLGITSRAELGAALKTGGRAGA